MVNSQLWSQATEQDQLSSPFNGNGRPLSPMSDISSFTNKAPSVTSAGSTRFKWIQDDTSFITVASALMDRHQVKNMSLKDAIHATFVDHEVKEFLEALDFRMGKLPMFPESNESNAVQLTRKLHKKFERVLHEMVASIDEEMTNLSPTAETRSPSQGDQTNRNSNRSDQGRIFRDEQRSEVASLANSNEDSAHHRARFYQRQDSVVSPTQFSRSSQQSGMHHQQEEQHRYRDHSQGYNKVASSPAQLGRNGHDQHEERIQSPQNGYQHEQRPIRSPTNSHLQHGERLGSSTNAYHQQEERMESPNNHMSTSSANSQRDGFYNDSGHTEAPVGHHNSTPQVRNYNNRTVYSNHEANGQQQQQDVHEETYSNDHNLYGGHRTHDTIQQGLIRPNRVPPFHKGNEDQSFLERKRDSEHHDAAHFGDQSPLAHNQTNEVHQPHSPYHQSHSPRNYQQPSPRAGYQPRSPAIRRLPSHQNRRQHQHQHQLYDEPKQMSGQDAVMNTGLSKSLPYPNQSMASSETHRVHNTSHQLGVHPDYDLIKEEEEIPSTPHSHLSNGSRSYRPNNSRLESLQRPLMHHEDEATISGYPNPVVMASYEPPEIVSVLPPSVEEEQVAEVIIERKEKPTSIDIDWNIPLEIPSTPVATPVPAPAPAPAPAPVNSNASANLSPTTATPKNVQAAVDSDTPTGYTKDKVTFANDVKDNAKKILPSALKNRNAPTNVKTVRTRKKKSSPRASTPPPPKPDNDYEDNEEEEETIEEPSEKATGKTKHPVRFFSGPFQRPKYLPLFTSGDSHKKEQSQSSPKVEPPPTSLTYEPPTKVDTPKIELPKVEPPNPEPQQVDQPPSELQKLPSPETKATTHTIVETTTNTVNDSSQAFVIKAIDGHYKLDISRNKSALLFNEAETLSKQTQLRKKLMDEVDRISLRIEQSVSEEEKAAYQQYLDELQVELEKWNQAARFGNERPGSEDSFIGSSLELPRMRPKPPRRRIRKSETLLTEVTKSEAESRSFYDKSEASKGGTENRSFYDKSQAGSKSYADTTTHGGDSLKKHDSFVSNITQDDKSAVTGPQQIEEPSLKSSQMIEKTKKSKAIHGDNFPDVRRQWKVVDVVAPATLPEGFQFEARVRDNIFLATVPKGGVTKGEVFATRMGDIYDETGNPAFRTRTFKDMDAPPSRWRDEIFDCFNLDLFHPFNMNAVFCPHVALAQVMARVQTTNTGDPVVALKSRTSICTYVWFMLFLIIVHTTYFSYLFVAEPRGDAFLIATMPLIGLDVLLLCYFISMVIHTRRELRTEYDIPELRCRGCEDCCLSLFCTCCTITQMGRHTADYEVYRGYCCTETGLASHIEVKLPSEFIVDDESTRADFV